MLDKNIIKSFKTMCKGKPVLTHWGRVTHICVSDLIIIGSDNRWLVAWSAPSHYQNQCWNIVNKTLRNKLQWIFNRNSNIFIEENTFENVVCEMLFISSRPQCVNPWTVAAYVSVLKNHAIGFRSRFSQCVDYMRFNEKSFCFRWQETTKPMLFGNTN